MKLSISRNTLGCDLLACIPDAGENRLDIPDGTDTISSTAMRSCTGITHITIPASVYNLFGEDFYAMTALEYISIRENKQHEPEKSLRRILTFSRDGVLFSKDPAGTCTLLRYPGGRSDPVYTVPDDVRIIGDYAFSNAQYLEHIILHENIWEIQDYAFAYCPRLKRVEIRSRQLLCIRKSAFQFCLNLTDVDIFGVVQNIEARAFHGCRSLERITLPGSLCGLEDEAFQSCSALKEITLLNSLPNSLPKEQQNLLPQIGLNVFYDCSALLKIRCSECTAAQMPEYSDRIVVLPSCTGEDDSR